jgi:hypothetical protein
MMNFYDNKNTGVVSYKICIGKAEIGQQDQNMYIN